MYFNNASRGNAAACGSDGVANGTLVQGTAESLVRLSVELDAAADLATLTLSGPAAVWFGVGFNASRMGERPWTVIVQGDGTVMERRLGDHAPGELLPRSLRIVSIHVANSVRTLVATRPLKGAPGGASVTFDPTPGAALQFINAVGSGPTFGYHKEKRPAVLTLLPTSRPGAPASVVAGVCLCARLPAEFGEATGSLQYAPVKGQPGEKGKADVVRFNNLCAPQPRSDLLAERNPTCDLRSYSGGQTACHHMWSLLDADQPIPWADTPLRYALKFRFWVQPYDPQYHVNVLRTTWGIASPVEYDVPKCNEATRGCSRATDRSWVHTIRGTFQGGGLLVAAHFHCEGLSNARLRLPSMLSDDPPATHKPLPLSPPQVTRPPVCRSPCTRARPALRIATSARAPSYAERIQSTAAPAASPTPNLTNQGTLPSRRACGATLHTGWSRRSIRRGCTYTP